VNGWTIIVPFKAPLGRKTRLASLYGPSERAELAAAWFAHVVDVAATFGFITLLSPADGAPDLNLFPPLTTWRQDFGRGLNAEVQALYDALRPGRVAIVHADLPMLSPGDMSVLLETAEIAGCAIASDRHGVGTNAIALADGREFRFAFGPDSFAQHLAAGGPDCANVNRPGLARDIDTPDDARDLMQLCPR